ncbi:3-oxoacyl-[acyl-carrier-protein] synthase III C-terminal domain-containing protein [Kutzneria sp. 744]|uniref:3-oxoacyl-[acyl-carrier-protein] synthase III C-terminal domain-containing protein n=1 Tax=Kutzneria sp. (strain 744) TaxID=345341 RepID=UPI0004AD2738
MVWGSDGSQSELISQDHSWLDWRDQLAKDPSAEAPALRMKGQPVFRWATVEMAKVARRTLEVAGIDVADLDAFIPHQANDRITEGLARSLRLPASVAIARDVIEQGNTSAASVPLAIDTMMASGAVRSGDTALLLGFGAGLSFAGQVVVLP